MTCIGTAHPGGLMGQTLRNLYGEPLIHNTRSADGTKEREGEVSADHAAILTGSVMGAATLGTTAAISRLVKLNNPAAHLPLWGKVLAGVGVAASALFAIDGWKNLHAKLDCKSPSPKPEPTPTPTPTPKPDPTPTPGPDWGNRPRTYTAKPGDDLTRIAHCTNVEDWHDIAAYNDLTNADEINVGQKFNIPPLDYHAGSDYRYVQTREPGKDGPYLQCGTVAEECRANA